MEYLILRERENLRAVLLKLQARGDAPRGDSIILEGTLQMALRGLVHVELILDTWPEFSAVVVRPERTKLVPTADGYELWYMLYGTNKSSLKKLISLVGVLDWKYEFFVYSLPESLCPALEEAASEQRGNLQCERRSKTCVFRDEVFEKMGFQLPSGCYFSPIKEDEVPYVLSKWAHAKSHLFRQQSQALQNNLRRNIYSCVRDAAGDVICFGTIRFFGGHDMAWVREDYRGQKVIHVMNSDLLSRLRQLKSSHRDLSFAYIRPENEVSTRIHQKLGTFLPEATRWYVYTPGGATSARL